MKTMRMDALGLYVINDTDKDKKDLLVSLDLLAELSSCLRRRQYC